MYINQIITYIVFNVFDIIAKNYIIHSNLNNQ